MANTVTTKVISASSKEAIVYLTLASDGTQETGTVVYDSSAVAALVGLSDPLSSTIISIYGSVSAASTARAFLSWDATTDVLALDIPVATNPVKANFRCQGGLPNQGGAGKTGDILLSTTGLASGDKLTLVLHVRRD